MHQLCLLLRTAAWILQSSSSSRSWAFPDSDLDTWEESHKHREREREREGERERGREREGERDTHCMRWTRCNKKRLPPGLQGISFWTVSREMSRRSSSLKTWQIKKLTGTTLRAQHMQLGYSLTPVLLQFWYQARLGNCHGTKMLAGCSCCCVWFERLRNSSHLCSSKRLCSQDSLGDSASNQRMLSLKKYCPNSESEISSRSKQQSRRKPWTRMTWESQAAGPLEVWRPLSSRTPQLSWQWPYLGMVRVMGLKCQIERLPKKQQCCRDKPTTLSDVTQTWPQQDTWNDQRLAKKARNLLTPCIFAVRCPSFTPEVGCLFIHLWHGQQWLE